MANGVKEAKIKYQFDIRFTTVPQAFHLRSKKAKMERLERSIPFVQAIFDTIYVVVPLASSSWSQRYAVVLPMPNSLAISP